MRIIAGLAKGMALAAPRGAHVRPTSDRVREAIFSSLGHRVVGADVLDLYAGTGALGLEAASRGARSVTFVEKARQSLDAIETNLARFQKNRGVDCEFCVLRGDVLAQVSCLAEAGRQFALIFADPPYADDPTTVLDASGRLLAPAGMFVLEMSRRSNIPVATRPGLEIPSRNLTTGLRLELEREATYGETRVCYFRAAGVGGH
jgi:16S rRNA (guanine966-N2)-methyltransferase